MRGINQVFLMGRVGEPLVLRHTQSGRALLEVRLATRHPGQGGEELTDWHRIRCWGELAEQLHRHLQPGAILAVQGQLRVESWLERSGDAQLRVYIQAERAHALLDARELPPSA